MDVDSPSEDNGYGPQANSDSETSNRGPLRPLGLINEDYQIFSPKFSDFSHQFPVDEFNLSLCLAGNNVWGAYDFGMFHGIMWFSERP